MTQENQKIMFDKKNMLNSLKSFVKIFICLIFVFFYILSAMFFLSPKFDAKIFSFFGMKKAEESCYVMQYQKSNDVVDLYNLVIFEQELNNDLKELSYINELINRKDYNDFCAKLDKSIIEQIEDKVLLTSLTTTNAYLISRKVKCSNRLNISGIETYIHSKLSLNSNNSNDLSECSFAVYVDIIESSSMTDNEKREKIETLLSVYSQANSKTVEELVEERLVNARKYIERSSDTAAWKYLVQKAVVETRKANVSVLKICGKSDAEINTAELLYVAAKQELASIYAQVKI